MKFPGPVIKGRLVQRYKRFLSDIDLGGKTVIAHCANPGSMMGLKAPGSAVWLTAATNPKRKLKYDWQVVETGGAHICVNTGLANKIVEDALTCREIAPLKHYKQVRREVKYGQSSRIDFLLTGENLPDCYVEVKNVTLSRKPGLAEFPDSPTARGTKHLSELAEMAKTGHRAVMLYLVNRTDCTDFALADDIDPAYAAAFKAARMAGVEAMAFATNITPEGISLEREIPLPKI